MSSVLKVYENKDGKLITSTLGDVNPEATNVQLAALGAKFSSLTNNAYAYSKKITTITVDTTPDESEG